MVMKEISETELSRLQSQDLLATEYLAMEASKRIKTAEKGHKTEAKRQAKFFWDLVEEKIKILCDQDPKLKEYVEQLDKLLGH